MNSLNNNYPTLAVIGGGRWAKVYLQILASQAHTFSQVIVVSRHCFDEMTSLTTQLSTTSKCIFHVVRTVEDLIQFYPISAAIIVNKAEEHFKSANFFLDQSIPLLIEKPVVLKTFEMVNLIRQATEKSICIVPGLSFQYCDYIKNFSKHIKTLSKPKKFSLFWSDAKAEFRYGELKKFNKNITIIQDVMPHIWTILSILFGQEEMEVISCGENSNDDEALLELRINHIEGTVLLSRNGLHRKRQITLETMQAEQISIDFAIEPGEIIQNGTVILADPFWYKKQSPLSKQLEYFFSIMDKGIALKDAHSSIASVKLSEEAQAHYLNRHMQAKYIHNE